MNALIAVSGLLLIPLVPAAVLYLVLTPKHPRGKQAAQAADGNINGPFGMKLHFSVVGSSATYVVLLVLAILVYQWQMQQASMSGREAWLVEVPVNLVGEDDQRIQAKNGEMQQVRVELEPSLTQASANTMQFWVVPNNDRFPTARFTLSSRSLAPETLDLNDKRSVKRDYDARRLRGIGPVWIRLAPAYEYNSAQAGPEHEP